MIHKIMLLGSGELGKEFVIAAKRMGQYVIACDSYENAPAMQVADEAEVFNMLDGTALDNAVKNIIRILSFLKLKLSEPNDFMIMRKKEFKLYQVPKLPISQ